MYEKLRNELAVELASFGVDTANKILLCIDKVMDRYEVSEKETHLATVEEIPSLVKTYLVVKKMENLSNNTLNSYKIVLELFFKQVNKPVDKITSNEIRLFLYSYQEEHSISSRTLDKYREYIARFFTWAAEEKYIETNPAKNIKAIKFETTPRKALTMEDLENLRASCKTIRDSAIIEVLYSTGCRVSELIGIKLSDIDFTDKSVHLFGKGKKHRTSFLNPRAEHVVKEYLKGRPCNSEYLFTSERAPYGPLTKGAVEAIVKKLSNATFGENGIKVTPHILRHTMATIALQRGMPVSDISTLLGHSSINTTMIYAEVSLDGVKQQHTKCVI